MKLLIIGGSGLIGSHLLPAARSAGHPALGTFRQFASPGLLAFDAADPAAAAALVETHSPHAVLYAAGWTWVDGCEDDPARALAENASQPAHLARLCADRGIHFTYLSTSYVFDGRHGPYAETAEPHPINAYGQSKWQGETRIQAVTQNKALIARVICVYGAERQQKNFACQVLRAMREGRSLSVPCDQRGNPTCAGDLARGLVALVEQRQSGICHLAGPKPDCDRVEWARMLVAAFTAAGIEPHAQFGIVPVSTEQLGQRAPRPLHAGLVSTRRMASQMPVTDFDKSVRDMLAELGRLPS